MKTIKKTILGITLLALISVAMMSFKSESESTNFPRKEKVMPTSYKTINVNGVDIFTEKQVKKANQPFYYYMVTQHHLICFVI